MSVPGRKAGIVALTLLLLAGAGAGAAAEAPDAFAINQRIGRGINLGNALEAPVEGEWGVTIQEEYFDIIKSAGFNSVRIAVRWSAHARNEKPYTVDANFFKRTDQVINQALARGLIVILTMHHYNELYADPAGHRERFLAIWKQIAARYKSYPATLVFEPLNEPHDQLGAAGWNPLIKELLPVIRESNPARTLVLGPVNYNDIQQLNALALPETDRNLIVSLHYYLPYPFTHQGAHWQPGSDAWLGTRWTGSEPEQRAVRDDFAVAAAWAKTNHRPICLCEFGANSKADMDSRARWTKFVADTAIEHGFSFTYWDFCAEFFGLYDPQTKSWRKPLLDAVIPPAGSAGMSALAMNRRLGRGVNIGGALDAPKEGDWGITLQNEYFQIIKDAGFDSIRLPVRWNAHAADAPPYTIDPDFFKRVDWAITNGLSRNLPVVLTTHHYDELYRDPDGQRDKFVAIWKQIAERYRDHPGTLVFDPLMEAQDKLDAGKWNSLLQETIAVIRRSNPHRTMVICPAGLSCIDNLRLLELPRNDRNLIVSIFYYAPEEFTQQGATWLPQAKAWLGTKWTGSEAERQRIAKDFDVAADWAKKHDCPIYLNEFGTYEKADIESRARWTRCVADAAVQRGFSFAYWEFCSGFGLYDLPTQSWHKELLEAVMPSEKAKAE